MLRGCEEEEEEEEYKEEEGFKLLRTDKEGIRVNAKYRKGEEKG